MKKSLHPKLAKVCREAVSMVDDEIAANGHRGAPVCLLFAETGLSEEDFRVFAIGWTLRAYVEDVDRAIRGAM